MLSLHYVKNPQRLKIIKPERNCTKQQSGLCARLSVRLVLSGVHGAGQWERLRIRRISKISRYKLVS